MQTLKATGTILVWIVSIVVFTFLIALYIAGLAWVLDHVHEYVDIAAITTLAVCVFVLLPCALFHSTRRVSAYGLFISSVIFGASIWILGFLLTLQYWGAMGVIVGIIMGVVGIVPLGILASAFHSDWSAAGVLTFGLVLTYGARMAAVKLEARFVASSSAIGETPPTIAILDPDFKTRRLLRPLIPLSVGVVSLVMIGLFMSLRGHMQQTLDDANAAYSRSDYETALSLFRPLAKQGNEVAEYNLAQMYFYGQGVPRSYDEANKWLRLAAEHGHAAAQNELASSYVEGRGVPQNYAEAARWYRKAADAGYAGAQANLGGMYMTGQGVPENDAEALKWLRLAADQGNAKGQFGLGAAYLSGVSGVQQNYAEAFKWFRLGADQGYAGAEFALGVIYANGIQAAPQNYVLAYMWSDLAAAQGIQDAAKNRDIVKLGMTPTQIAEAQKLAREWKLH